MTIFKLPPKDCSLCSRLVAFRDENRKRYPDKFNGVVPPFGGQDARLLIVGLAPGLQGANFTGRPFTGDWAGDTLYGTLLKFGFAKGKYAEKADDGLTLVDSRITNAVRCVPPENKPTGAEISACGSFLKGEIDSLSRLEVIVALGTVAHGSVLRALSLRPAKDFPFAHGKVHAAGNGLKLIDSYHCSRYNTNTGVLTQAMFEDIFIAAKDILSRNSRQKAG